MYKDQRPGLWTTLVCKYLLQSYKWLLLCCSVFWGIRKASWHMWEQPYLVVWISSVKFCHMLWQEDLYHVLWLVKGSELVFRHTTDLQKRWDRAIIWALVMSHMDMLAGELYRDIKQGSWDIASYGANPSVQN